MQFEEFIKKCKDAGEITNADLRELRGLLEMVVFRKLIWELLLLHNDRKLAVATMDFSQPGSASHALTAQAEAKGILLSLEHVVDLLNEKPEDERE